MIDKKIIMDELVSRGMLSRENLAEALAESQRSGAPIDKILLKKGVVTEDRIAMVVSEQIGVPFMDLTDYAIDESAVKMIPEPTASKFKLIPLFKIGHTITIAMANPQDINAIDQIRLIAKCEVEPVIATESAIKSSIDKYYGVTPDIESAIKTASETQKTEGFELAGVELGKLELEKLVDAAPVVRLVNLILMDAIKDKASDIHIEPAEDMLNVRYRVDGMLHKGPTPPQELAAAIISRIKILANMDIAEKRKPQDGRIQIKMQERNIDLRISTFPTVYGENIVIRILDTATLLIGLSDLGMSQGTLKEFEKLIKRPYGILLVTGPTGSGKTTTLYAALSAISTVEKNIITIEDPVEYNLKSIRQTQINPKAGLTFANGLRSILRQDPDIIMVGEIRDNETAEIATHAALTGHLVFSTLHTNDACGAVARLIDMGVEPFLVASSVVGVLAQRLVRTICPKCRKEVKPTDDMLKELGIVKKGDITFYEGKGCNHCKNMGYVGRSGIYELVIIDDEIKKLIAAKASADAIKKKAIESGMKTLRDDGMEKALKGITSVEEVLRVSHEE